jgi:TetR/AcrR family transcriptional regulator
MSSANAVGKEALIRAACELLEQLPPARVTRAEVARHAGVDPALIRYYFKDRASLLQAVVEQVTNESGASPSAPIVGEHAAERLRSGATNFLHFMVTHPYFHRLALEELAGSDSDEARDIFRKINQSSVARHKAIVDDGVAKGEIKPVNPLLLHIAQIGLCEFFVAARPIIEATMGEDADMEALTSEYAAFIGDMIEGALKR